MEMRTACHPPRMVSAIVTPTHTKKVMTKRVPSACEASDTLSAATTLSRYSVVEEEREREHCSGEREREHCSGEEEREHYAVESHFKLSTLHLMSNVIRNFLNL